MATTDTIEETVRTFHWLDYTIFTLSLILSLFVGIFTGAKDWADLKFEKKGSLWSKSVLSRQLLGGKDLKPFPVALSLLATFLSAPFILGTPAELYTYGSMYGAIILGYIVATPITAHLFVPVFHAQQMTSAYEFIEKRFSHWMRLFGSCLFSIMMLLYMAVVIYAPAVAFAQVTGLPTLASILGVGIICTIYTALGGMKAVVWTDVVQTIIIIVGILALIIKGTVDVGGPDTVWDRVIEGDRLQTDEWSLNPSARHTWWTQIIGGFVITVAATATNQAMIQRYLSVKTTKDAQKSVYYAGALNVTYTFMILILAFVMFAFYHDCDPVATGRIHNKDQLVPVFVMDSLGDVIGLPGLFSASVFAASLSTVSSGVNSLAAVTMADIVLPIYRRNKMRKMPDIQAARLAKLLSVVFGLLTMALAFLIPLFGSTLIQAALSLFGMIGGPLLGLFILAIFFPFANEWGAFFGTAGSLVITSWITIGGILYPSEQTPLPIRTDGCPFNFTVVENNVTEASGNFVISDLYSVSYMWYALLSVFVSLLIGIPTSLLTGGNDQREKQDLSLLYPYHRKCRPCFICCACDNCMNIEDEEEVGEAHVYAVDRVRKRSSVDSVFGMYHEDPGLKRSSIAIQYGSAGKILGGTIDKVPLHMIGHRPEDLAGILEEQEEEENGKSRGVDNPSFRETVTVHPAITLNPNTRNRTGSAEGKIKARLGPDMRRGSTDFRRGSTDIRRGSHDIGRGSLVVDPKALEELHQKVEGEVRTDS